MYWTDRGYWEDIGTGKIQRANLDGSNVEDLVTQGLDDPDGIALNVANGKMYGQIGVQIKSNVRILMAQTSKTSSLDCNIQSILP